MVMKERDEELALFLEMRRREKEKSNLLLPLNSDEQNAPLGTKCGGSPISKIVSSVPLRKTAAENFLNSENEKDKSDYDWLLTPPGTPLFPSLEMESQKAKVNQMEMPNVRPTALRSKIEIHVDAELQLANIQEQPASKSNVVSRNPSLQSGVNSFSTGYNTPSLSGGRTSSARAATPTGRHALITTAKSLRPSTPTSRANLPSSKPTAPAVRSSTPTKSTARSSAPTARPTVTASNPAQRSATPTCKSTIRSATPSSRPTARSATPTSRPMVRSSTPTHLPLAPSCQPSAAAAPGRSASVSKSGSTSLKNSVPSRGTSPPVKSRPWKPFEMPGFSLDAPPNLRTSLPERPASASRGRPGAPSVQSPSGSSSKGCRRQQSCSPSRGRASNDSAYNNRSSITSSQRAHASDGDDVNPVIMGTKMVERVVNMRKLAPPKQYNNSLHNNSAGKSFSSLDSSGFGRTLSKKSLDMALRHMDIRRSVAGNLRPLTTNIPASSMYSVRSGSTKSRTVSVTDSPLATSSNASSEPSVNNNSFILDGSEIEDNHDFGSERGNSSPVSQHCHHGR